MRHAPGSVDLLLLGAFAGLAGLPHVADEAAPALVAAVDELPPADLREALVRIAARGRSGVHLLVATREPEAVEDIVGAGLRVTMGVGGHAVARDGAGRTWELRAPGTSSLPPLVIAMEAIARSLGLRT